MSHIRDGGERELQVAAVLLCGEGKVRLEDVAAKLTQMYPDQDKFTIARVHRLIKAAINGRLAMRNPLATLVSSPDIDKLVKKVEQTRQSNTEAARVEAELARRLKRRNPKHQPVIRVVTGDVSSVALKTSEYARQAVRVALDLLWQWQERHEGSGRVHIGVTWGRQIHNVVTALDGQQQERIRNSKFGLSFLPTVGLPIGRRSDDVLSSTELCRMLNSHVDGRIRQEDYDLQLVPAYFPAVVFTDVELGSMQKLLRQISGWIRIFPDDHMTMTTTNVHRGIVSQCDFIWSSISDINEPYGFSTSRNDPLLPFAQTVANGSVETTRPVADCGGIPLWGEVDAEDRAVAEQEFSLRWTGIRRHQWRHCVEKGHRSLEETGIPCGAVVFAPTATKAKSVVLAMRSGLVNFLILGQPCADRLLNLLS